MTTPQIALHRRTASRGTRTAAGSPLAPRLAYPFLLVGLLTALAGYAAVALLLVQLVLGLL